MKTWTWKALTVSCLSSPSLPCRLQSPCQLPTGSHYWMSQSLPRPGARKEAPPLFSPNPFSSGGHCPTAGVIQGGQRNRLSGYLFFRSEEPRGSRSPEASSLTRGLSSSRAQSPVQFTWCRLPAMVPPRSVTTPLPVQRRVRLPAASDIQEACRQGFHNPAHL